LVLIAAPACGTSSIAADDTTFASAASASSTRAATTLARNGFAPNRNAGQRGFLQSAA